MVIKLTLISLLVAVVSSGLINQQSLSNEITDRQHPLLQPLSADDSNFSDEQEGITDFLENIFHSDDADRSRERDSHERDGDNDSKPTDFLENIFHSDDADRSRERDSHGRDGDNDSKPTDFLENIFLGDDADKSRERDSHERDGDNDSKPTDFLENIFGINAGGSSRSADLNGGISNHDGGSSKVDDLSETVLGGDDVKHRQGEFATGDRLDDSRENSKENDSRSAENDSRPKERDSKEKDGDDKDSKEEGRGDKDDNKSTEDDSGTCQAYSVGVSDHEFTLTTPDGCKIVIKLNGLKSDQKTTFHEVIQRNVRTVEISYDD